MGLKWVSGGFWRILSHFWTQKPTFYPPLDPFQEIDKNSRIPLVRSSSESVVHRIGKAEALLAQQFSARVNPHATVRRRAASASIKHESKDP